MVRVKGQAGRQQAALKQHGGCTACLAATAADAAGRRQRVGSGQHPVAGPLYCRRCQECAAGAREGKVAGAASTQLLAEDGVGVCALECKGADAAEQQAVCCHAGAELAGGCYAVGRAVLGGRGHCRRRDNMASANCMGSAPRHAAGGEAVGMHATSIMPPSHKPALPAMPNMHPQLCLSTLLSLLSLLCLLCPPALAT